MPDSVDLNAFAVGPVASDKVAESADVDCLSNLAVVAECPDPLSAATIAVDSVTATMVDFQEM